MFLLLSMLSIPVRAEGQSTGRVQQTQTPVVIVLDPGHGGKNDGTTENGFLEKSMTMITALAAYEELQKYDGIEVYLTHTEDEDMSLKERAEFAASVNADFLFSIHYNASENHELFGSEVWISCAPPYHAYGYQFGWLQMKQMEEMGLSLRGIKTRQNNDKEDYYGVIRECVALEVPAVIIEHCHVDEPRDTVFLSSDEDLKAFGVADATSIARYFGLKSTILGVDYSTGVDYPAILPEEKNRLAFRDETAPDICIIEKKAIDTDDLTVTLDVSAADYDSMLLYYDYSLDGGLTYSTRQLWPDCNIYDGSYRDSFPLTLEIPEGTVNPSIVIRAYNNFDLFLESNTVKVEQVFSSARENSADQAISVLSEASDISSESLQTVTFTPDSQATDTASSKALKLKNFLGICVIIVIVLLIIVLTSQFIAMHQKSKRRRRKLADKRRERYDDKPNRNI